jgi:hypothetical protein
LTNGRQITYAAGLQVTQAYGTSEVAHSGATGGYRTWLARYPDKQLSVAVLCNAAEAVPTSLGRQTAQLWLGGPTTAPNAPFDASGLSGLYRNLRNHTAFEIKADSLTKDASGKLRLGGAELTPIDSPVKGFRLTDSNDISLFERVESFAPTAAQLKDYSGAYTSPEATEQLNIRLAASDKLQLVVGHQDPLELKPTYRDAFSSPNGAVRFHRDSQNRITGLSVGDGRVWDFRFNKQAF